MSEDRLAQRRNWYRFFPGGSIEFVIVTRVLALLLLLALAVVPGTQRPTVLLALAGVLWIDYLLIIWWAIQVTTDLDALFADPPPSADVLRRRRIRAAILGALPATAALVILAPWPSFVLPSEPARAATIRMVLIPLLGVLFVALLVPAHRALRRIQLAPPRWTLPLLIPIVHWFAMHRLLIHLHARLRLRSQERGMPTTDDPGPAPAVILADLTWVLSILPWGILLVVVLLRGEWPSGVLYSAVPSCGTAVAALFAISDLAAMENVQRQFVALIRK